MSGIMGDAGRDILTKLSEEDSGLDVELYFVEKPTFLKPCVLGSKSQVLNVLITSS